MKLIYDTINKAFSPWPRTDDKPVVGLEPHLVEMTVIQDVEPVYDSETQTIEKIRIIDLEAKTVTKSWKVVNGIFETAVQEGNSN